ncbi:hypothetical protein TNCV_4038051 [Trichonephila clavipes]|nr:hypothetical protein TNCV_4038051 [Trichonephila clavipes]
MLEGEKSFTKGGQMRHASLEIVCEWIMKAWNEIKPDLIQKSFKKCSISNSLDGTEDGYLFMEESNSDGENDTDFDEHITEDEYANFFMLSNNEKVHKTVLEAKREEFVHDAIIYAKSLCEELEISFEQPPRRIRRKHIFGDGSKDVHLYIVRR